MTYCGEKGIPHSTFLSWPEEDQDKAIASLIHDRSNCSQCGTNPNDWVGENLRQLDPPPFVAEVIRCFGCHSLEEARQEIPSESREEYHVFLRPNREL